MKRLLILLGLPLVLSSCLLNEEDKFPKSATERMNEAIEQAENVLQGAVNGWRVELYPEKSRIYGGYTMFLEILFRRQGDRRQREFRSRADRRVLLLRRAGQRADAHVQHLQRDHSFLFGCRDRGQSGNRHGERRSGGGFRLHRYGGHSRMRKTQRTQIRQLHPHVSAR